MEESLFQFMPILQDGAGAGQLVSMLIPFGLIILVFYFLIIRPQNKKQKETQAMLASIKKNDRVVTIGGMRGTVQAVRDDAIVLKVDENVKLEFNKSAIASVIRPQVSKNGSKDASEDIKEAKASETEDKSKSN
jgi:preprotein translocase subunit YajC